jgi:hypothetical protein
MPLSLKTLYRDPFSAKAKKKEKGQVKKMALFYTHMHLIGLKQNTE